MSGRARERTVLGMLSGTSVDAIDTALVRFARDADDPSVLHGEVLGVGERDWDADLRDRLLAAPSGRGAGGDGGAEAWCRLHAEAGAAFGAVARDVLAAAQDAGIHADLVSSHGQTLHHGVEDGRAWGTLQIGDPTRVAAATGLPVLADLRSADIAAGGQGAPLVPLLDQLLLGDEPSAVLNIGGIGNVSIVGSGDVLAGDTGPGNALLDAAVHAATGGRERCDRDGVRARAGHVDRALLAALLTDPFYALPAPRSTGREHFHAGHVRDRAAAAGLAGIDRISLEDLLATLVELTARTIAATVAELGRGRGLRRVVGSGGGMDNPVLRERLEQLLDPLPLIGPEVAGLTGASKEAVLMALIGWMSAERLPGVLARSDGTAVTGARGPVVLGSWTPAPDGALPLMPDDAGPPVPVRRLILDDPDPEEHR